MNSSPAKAVADSAFLSSPDKVLCEEDERNLAYVVYALLFVSPFSMGLTALIGAGLAYLKKRDCVSYVQTHFRYQIKNFWVVFALWAVANSIIVVCTMVFLVTLTRVMLTDESVTDMQNFLMNLSTIDTDDIPMSTTLGVVSGYVVSALLTLLATIWILIAAIGGVLRLNQHKPIGKRAQTA
ncbi:MAG: hypothetical protein QM667_02850 [Asticcacaulis sp.]